ncbi:UDP-N-acetylmuramyl pentapeptide phosphotransferase/UDP-N-acetylglucosamine-1-phosphate transferase [Flavobacterium segetis]|uniref:UDP-N-acetylmuramyl pentapeptide phosphotransferase/UDP-N-acetylglucosamine-1-phosphate transferase n=1 Tax=Flavobacterium segetis TaxID=271157 RepID=A0A1M5J810_9FLAO|nr:UDP-GlcNAc--UDP-phosphate GlcNAc-1-phosphate transferase [Flavobacterium segetis]SHG36746.1 UDP-N-acetylmuramyl pentapeptide phosphotransferase/UDP-N-acetylglucosamine-1-phosphate transferase [Flavobacterium segetis]
MLYLGLLILFIALELVYFKIADKYNIIDKPNARSSHTAITIRGGGILFPFAISIAYLLGYISWQITIAVALVAVISFIDDVKPLSQLPRFASHAIAVGLVFFDLHLFSEAIWILVILFVLIIGWINAFNFMDGINGITVLYSLISIVTFAFLPVNQTSLPVLITMGISCLVFGLFNVRKKAKTFAGDVGSISMALFLGYFMIKSIVESGQFGFVLFFAVYGIDAVITIVSRLVKKENIFQPHRSHLYQYLANEKGFSHVVVASLYASAQLMINIVVVYMDGKGYLSLNGVGLFLLLLTFIYLMIRVNILSQLSSKYQK